jgi:hypothetical protein
MLLRYAPKSGHFSIGVGKPPVNNLRALFGNPAHIVRRADVHYVGQGPGRRHTPGGLQVGRGACLPPIKAASPPLKPRPALPMSERLFETEHGHAIMESS